MVLAEILGLAHFFMRAWPNKDLFVNFTELGEKEDQQVWLGEISGLVKKKSKCHQARYANDYSMACTHCGTFDACHPRPRDIRLLRDMASTYYQIRGQELQIWMVPAGAQPNAIHFTIPHDFKRARFCSSSSCSPQRTTLSIYFTT
ncbi:hypothetical protein Syun_026604 [Stephania yunnanensis]|uniref:Uncharacterized protein n=1 Tax=Stephania yunnanensis TaxID=152371 RepID=A0AAP0EU97_9MAGN